MNDRLRSILRTAWNEPRHFFMWLAILSVLGFIAIALGLTAGQKSVSVKNELGLSGTLIGFAALSCILGVVLGILGFVLAWIPPVRELFASLLARRLLVMGCVVTLVALFYAIENWRGRHAWQSFKREREVRGERFDVASFIPPPVPNDQNFFETRLWDDLRYVRTDGQVVWLNTNWANNFVLSIYVSSSKVGPSTGNWADAQHVDQAAWQGYYRDQSNGVAAAAGLNQAAQRAFLKRYGVHEFPTSPPIINSFPVASEPQSPAKDVLLALSKLDADRAVLIASSARPHARFWINYDDGPGALLPHLARLSTASKYLALHATAALTGGDRATALEDVSLQFRLMDSVRSEPCLVSHLVRIALLQIAVQPVWEGLAGRQWQEADLSVIESELGKLDFLAEYQFGRRGDRAVCDLWAVDYIRKVGIAGLNEILGSSRSAGRLDLEHFLGGALFRLVPAGWFDQSKVSLCRLYEDYLLPVVDVERRTVSPPLGARAQTAITRLHTWPYDLTSTFLQPRFPNAWERIAYGQTCVELARVACALERFRLANGQFPETLQALAPRFIETLTHEVINGQPLKYRRTDDGQFVLYSVGWNETDDGGTVVSAKNGNLDQNKGDWVWRYPKR